MNPEQQASILDNASMNGALELRPQARASIAIIARQFEMACGLGKAQGMAFGRGA